MKKVLEKVKTLLISGGIFLSYFISPAFAQSIGDEPARLRSAELIFAQALIAVWALSIPYFIFVIASIGVRWMLAMGDENKLAQLKQRGSNVILSFVFVFGGFLFVKAIMAILGFRSPGDCFADGSQITDPFFQFFFPEVCTGCPPGDPSCP